MTNSLTTTPSALAPSSPITDAFLLAMVSRGYCAQVAVGSKAAIELIEWYLRIWI